MASLKEVRNRIGSIKNTRKITQAMSRIAAARLRRAQNAMSAARPYGTRLEEMVSRLVAGLGEDFEHPLLEKRRVEKVLVISVTADRGLCGGFNTNVGREVRNLVAKQKDLGREVVSIAVGRKVLPFLKQAKQEATLLRPAPDSKNALELAHEIATYALTMFERGREAVADAESLPDVDEVWLVYNHFKNVLTQETTAVRLLPISADELVKGDDDATAREVAYEPNREGLLAHLLPVAVETRIQQAFLNSAAAEIAARRTAMDAATDNASALISELTLEYNRQRQAAITTELMEIIGGAEALKG